MAAGLLCCLFVCCCFSKFTSILWRDALLIISAKNALISYLADIKQCLRHPTNSIIVTVEATVVAAGLACCLLLFSNLFPFYLVGVGVICQENYKANQIAVGNFVMQWSPLQTLALITSELPGVPPLSSSLSPTHFGMEQNFARRICCCVVPLLVSSWLALRTKTLDVSKEAVFTLFKMVSRPLLLLFSPLCCEMVFALFFFT